MKKEKKYTIYELTQIIPEREDIFLDEYEYDFVLELYNKKLIDDSFINLFNSIENVKAYLYFDVNITDFPGVTKKDYIKTCQYIKDNISNGTIFDFITVKFKNFENIVLNKKDFKILKKMLEKKIIDKNFLKKFKLATKNQTTTKLVDLIEEVVYY